MKMRILSAVMLSAMLACTTGMSATWYVAVDGNDANAGTNWISGKANIQTAIDASVDGDVVLVGPGTYTDSLVISNKSIAVRSALGPSATTIDLESTLNKGALEIVGPLVRGGVVVFDGFRVCRGRLDPSRGGLPSGAEVQIVRVDGCSPVIRNCFFEDCSIGNWTTSGRSARLLSVHRIPDNKGPTIANCVFQNNALEGHNKCLIQLTSRDGTAAAGTVQNCIFAGNYLQYYRYSGLIYSADVIWGGRVENTIVWGNSFDEDVQSFHHLITQGVSVESCLVEGGEAGGPS